MTAPASCRGGSNVAMKIPTHQFDAAVEAYERLGIPVLERTAACVTFEFGPMRLHLDRVTHLSQAEIWLEFIVADRNAAAGAVERAGFTRCDGVEALPAGFPGFWVTSPAAIVHLVSETE
ncbi:MAG: hypothetical protein RIC56_06040 [Pseudomonadales bacterium]